MQYCKLDWVRMIPQIILSHSNIHKGSGISRYSTSESLVSKRKGKGCFFLTILMWLKFNLSVPNVILQILYNLLTLSINLQIVDQFWWNFDEILPKVFWKVSHIEETCNLVYARSGWLILMENSTLSVVSSAFWIMIINRPTYQSRKLHWYLRYALFRIFTTILKKCAVKYLEIHFLKDFITVSSNIDFKTYISFWFLRNSLDLIEIEW